MLIRRAEVCLASFGLPRNPDQYPDQYQVKEWTA
jgi:hypothetical protein